MTASSSSQGDMVRKALKYKPDFTCSSPRGGSAFSLREHKWLDLLGCCVGNLKSGSSDHSMCVDPIASAKVTAAWRHCWRADVTVDKGLSSGRTEEREGCQEVLQ